MARVEPLSPHRRRATWRLALFFLAAALLLPVLAGCWHGPAAAQPGTLAYEGPQAYTLKPGEPLPGTDIRFVRQSAEGAELTIGGQKAIKQKADSLNWSGSPAKGVQLDLRLRIVWFTQDALYAAGTAKVTVTGVAPRAGTIATTAPLAYELPVACSVPTNGVIPGSTLNYVGKAPDGAQFKGVEGYPYRQIGDSLRWEGWLRGNVAARQDLRVVQYDDGGARLGGVIHLWIAR